jgi:uncharacterized protein (DUF2336 family)
MLDEKVALEDNFEIDFTDDVPVSGGDYNFDLLDQENDLTEEAFPINDIDDEKEILVDQLARDLQSIMNQQENGSVEGDQAVQKLILLLRQTEKHVLQSLSLYLCELKGVPERIVQYLAMSPFQVAKPMLEKSPSMSEELLKEVIDAKSAEYWRTIAKRYDLTDDLVDSLAACKDLGTSTNLLDNENINLTDKAFEYCSQLAKDHQELAQKISSHPNIPEHVALSVYWQVSFKMREELLKKHNISKAHLTAAFKAALADFNDSIRGSSDPSPTPLMWELARKYKRLNKITPSTLAKTLHDGRTRFFIALFSEYTGINYMTVYNAMKQPGGRVFTLICRAFGFRKEYFISLFLKARSLVHSEKVVDSEELHVAIKFFDSITPDKAKEIISAQVA